MTISDEANNFILPSRLQNQSSASPNNKLRKIADNSLDDLVAQSQQRQKDAEAKRQADEIIAQRKQDSLNTVKATENGVSEPFQQFQQEEANRTSNNIIQRVGQGLTDLNKTQESQGKPTLFNGAKALAINTIIPGFGSLLMANHVENAIPNARGTTDPEFAKLLENKDNIINTQGNALISSTAQSINQAIDNNNQLFETSKTRALTPDELNSQKQNDLVLNSLMGFQSKFRYEDNYVYDFTRGILNADVVAPALEKVSNYAELLTDINSYRGALGKNDQTSVDIQNKLDQKYGANSISLLAQNPDSFTQGAIVQKFSPNTIQLPQEFQKEVKDLPIDQTEGFKASDVGKDSLLNIVKKIGNDFTTTRQQLGKDFAGAQMFPLALISPTPAYAPGNTVGVNDQNTLQANYEKSPQFVLNRYNQAISAGVTNGLTFNIIPNSFVPENIGETAAFSLANVLSSTVAIGGLSKGITAAALSSDSITALALKYPTAYNYIKSALTFTAAGQLNPDLSNRFDSLAKDFALSIPFTSAEGLSWKQSVPVTFTLGYVGAKLDGADDGEAIKAGVIFSASDAFMRGNEVRSTKYNADLVDKSIDILSEYSGTKVDKDSSPVELRKAFVDAMKATYPSEDHSPEAAAKAYADNSEFGKVVAAGGYLINGHSPVISYAADVVNNDFKTPETYTATDPNTGKQETYDRLSIDETNNLTPGDSITNPEQNTQIQKSIAEATSPSRVNAPIAQSETMSPDINSPKEITDTTLKNDLTVYQVAKPDEGSVGVPTVKSKERAEAVTKLNNSEPTKYIIPEGSKVKIVHTQGKPINEVYTADQLNKFKDDGYVAIQNVSKGSVREVRILDPQSVTSKTLEKSNVSTSTPGMSQGDDIFAPNGRIKIANIDKAFGLIPENTVSPNGYIKKIGDKLFPTDKLTPEILKDSHISLNDDGSVKESILYNKTIFTESIVTPKNIEELQNKFKTSEIPIYHATNEKFENFDISKSADGSIWFTDNKKDITDPNRGVSAPTKIVMTRYLPSNLKLANQDQIDKYSVDELLQQGYDGVKYEPTDKSGTFYQIFNPEKLLKKQTKLSKIETNKDLTDKQRKEAQMLFHGSASGELKVDQRGNINLGTVKEEIMQFAENGEKDILTIPPDALKVKVYDTKDEIFKIAANPKLKKELIDQGIDVILSENHAIAINPESFSKKVGLPLREDIYNKPISEVAKFNNESTNISPRANEVLSKTSTKIDIEDKSSKEIAKIYNNIDWFHGTKGEISDYKSISTFGYSDVRSLLGMGFYLTNDPIIAESYSKRKGSGPNKNVYKINVSVDHVLNADIKLTSVLKDNLVKAVDPDLRDSMKTFLDDNPSSNLLQFFKELRHQFADSEISVDEATLTFQDLTSAISDSGFDSITHEGGIATKSDKRHSVLILLDPNHEVINEDSKSNIKSLTKHETATVKSDNKVEISTEIPTKVELSNSEAIPISQGIGNKLKESKAFTKIEDKLPDEIKEKTKPTYETMDMAENNARALELIDKDYNIAKKIALGYEAPVEGITQVALATAVTNKAIQDGDFQLAADVARRISLQGTRFGQEIVSFRGRLDTDQPQDFIDQVLERKIDAKYKNRRSIIFKKGEERGTVESPKKRMMKDIDKMVTQTKSLLDAKTIKIRSAQEIIDLLTCK